MVPGHKAVDPNSIMLLTKYKNAEGLTESEKLFTSIHEKLTANRPGFIIGGRPALEENLFETLNTQVFVEEPDASTGFKLLTKK